MRALPAAALLAFLLLLPAAQAQATPGPSFQLTVTAPSEAVAPGNHTGIVLKIERICPNAATVLEQQEATIQFIGFEGGIVSGPAQAVFPQQVCAQQMTSEQAIPYVVDVPRDANASALPFVAKVHPGASGPLTPGSPEASAAFTIAVAEPGAVPQPQAEVEQASPSPAFALVGLALLGLALVLRR